MMSSKVRVRRAKPSPAGCEPPTAEQLRKVRRVVEARGLEMPFLETKAEAQRWLDVRNMFVNPDANAGGYSENARAGREGARSRWGK